MVAQQALQAAIYTRLSDVANGLMSLVKGVFDEVPDNQAEPYVEIGDWTETPSDYFGSEASNLTLMLQVYSTAQGKKEVQLILEKIDAIMLAKPRPTLEGMTVVDISREMYQTLREGDSQIGIRRRGIAQYRFFVTKP